MIRAIVAIDEMRGIADNNGIPWAGRIPSDIKYYQQKITGHDVIMGYNLYQEFAKPYSNCDNFVATRQGTKLREGFININDPYDFILNYREDLWNIGGAGLYASTMDLNDELYITQLSGEYGCTKFFPEFNEKFRLVEESNPITENKITFTFQVWKKVK